MTGGGKDAKGFDEGTPEAAMVAELRRRGWVVGFYEKHNGDLTLTIWEPGDDDIFVPRSRIFTAKKFRKMLEIPLEDLPLIIAGTDITTQLREICRIRLEAVL